MLRPSGMRLLLLLPLLLAAACGSSDGAAQGEPGPTSGQDSPAGGSSAPQDDLVVEVRAGPDTPVQRYTLVCAGVAEGEHPEPAAACDHLRGLDEPFAPLGTDLLCTEVYGGPQTAHITGRWGGQPVDLRLSRENGCLISQWDSLGPLLPGPVGADLPGELPR